MTLHQLFLGNSEELNNLGLLMIRLFIGTCFIVHALGKLGLVGSGSMAGFESWLASMNIPFAALQARLAMFSELIGGTMILLGLGTRFGCLVCIFVMSVAAIIGHRGGGYLITNNPPGNEYTINLAAICALILIFGPGAYSLDQFIFAAA